MYEVDDKLNIMHNKKMPCLTVSCAAILRVHQHIHRRSAQGVSSKQATGIFILCIICFMFCFPLFFQLSSSSEQNFLYSYHFRKNNEFTLVVTFAISLERELLFDGKIEFIDRRKTLKCGNGIEAGEI